MAIPFTTFSTPGNFGYGLVEYHSLAVGADGTLYIFGYVDNASSHLFSWAPGASAWTDHGASGITGRVKVLQFDGVGGTGTLWALVAPNLIYSITLAGVATLAWSTYLRPGSFGHYYMAVIPLPVLDIYLSGDDGLYTNNRVITTPGVVPAGHPLALGEDGVVYASYPSRNIFVADTAAQVGANLYPGTTVHHVVLADGTTYGAHTGGVFKQDTLGGALSYPFSDDVRTWSELKYDTSSGKLYGVANGAVYVAQLVQRVSLSGSAAGTSSGAGHLDILIHEDQNTLLDRGYSGFIDPARPYNIPDYRIRGLYPIPGKRLLAVTEQGAYLKDQPSELTIGSMKITNKWDDTADGFSTFGCSVPFWHVNVNLLSDGRTDPFGFVTVRRTDDEDGFAVWNIHFDPSDLTSAGPVIGKFHFPRDGFFEPNDQFRLQEVTWLDGCSTSTLHAGHQSGYQPNTYLNDPHLNTNRVQPLNGGSWPNDDRPNRFWDSYLVFRVLISIQTRGIPERPWAYGPIPKALSAYLIFANGGSRGPTDPPLKLVRVHITNPAVATLGGDAWPGEQVLNGWLSNQFRNNKPYMSSLPVGVGNYMYTGPSRAGWAAYADQSTRNNAEFMNIHGEWMDSIWITVDDSGDWNRSEPVLAYPESLEIPGFENVFGWNHHLELSPDSYRDDCLGGMTSSRFFTTTPEGKLWVPGMFVANQMDYGLWENGLANPVLPDWAAGQSTCYRRYQTAIRAVAARGRAKPDVATAQTWVSSLLGIGG